MVEADYGFAYSIKNTLQSYSYDVTICSNSAEFFKQLNVKPPDIIILNITHIDSNFNGADIFRILLSEHKVPSKLIGYSKIKELSWLNEVHKIGNFYLNDRSQEFSVQNLIRVVNNAIHISKQEEENLALTVENIFLKKSLIETHPFIGESEAIKKAKNQIINLSNSDEDIFLIGETGTGKEVAAYYYYFNSPRFGKPVQTVNCSALTETLIESELFGHVKGSFTNADTNKVGLFEQSSNGILFLDEITNISMPAQAKLLRAIENKEIQVVGGESKKVNTRLIFASNADYHILTKPDVIRKDLFFRIESNIVELPPLRERDSDIPMLFNYFIRGYASHEQLVDFTLTEDVSNQLMQYNWPGNVRELKNFCKYILINERVINSDNIRKHLEFKSIKNSKSISNSINHVSFETHKTAINNFEREFLIQNLNQNNWHVSETARKLGLERTTLYKKIKLYKLTKHNHDD
jgi:DNA-binding NtrC family response regulator